jgi:hypothetical protein
MPNDESEKDDQARLLRCQTCGRTIECSRTEIIGYLNSGWPKCCGETMTLFIEAKLPKGSTS